jgi:hypothetical protein
MPPPTAEPSERSLPATISSASTSRPHRAARFEDALDTRLATFLRRRGWIVRVEPYVGYGAPGWVRVLGRAVLAGPGVTDSDLPGVGARPGSGPARPVAAVRGWRSFAVVQAPFTPVAVIVGAVRHELVTDRGGYVDAVVPADLSPGWHDVELVTSDGRTATVPVIVIGPGTRSGIVSDIHDTVMATRLSRLFIAAWNTFMRHENAREPMPGMADFYRRILLGHADAPVVYVSTGAWNAAPAIGRFLRRNGYPTGPLLLTDWGPTNTGWFRSGPEHKRAALRRLLAEFPDIRWVLVGDDGQRDPRIYAEVVRERPERVAAVVIRRLTEAQQVLAPGAPTPRPGTMSAEVRAQHGGVPVLHGPDGAALLREWIARGIALD